MQKTLIKLFLLSTHTTYGQTSESIGIHSGNEFPDSNDLIGELETLFEERKMKGQIVAYSIAIDVRITNSQFPQSTDAIAIKTYHVQRTLQTTYYYPYEKLADKVQLLEGWGEVA